MQRSSYEYNLPAELIAQRPLPRRDASRLLHLDRANGEVRHLRFPAILDLLRPGDLLVRNRTKVLPARLLGSKPTGGSVEVLLHRRIEDKLWECLVRPGRRLPPGAKVIFDNGLSADIEARTETGGRLVRFVCEGDFEQKLAQVGRMPLPPYIRRQADERDKRDYQTVFARDPGSVAAPTAGLHFTPELLAELERRGIRSAEVALHVGLGTFRPVQTEDIRKHVMHEEECELPPETAEAVNSARAEGRRVVAIGTTTTRTLESFADADGTVNAGRKRTDLFIYPGRRLRVIDGLLTNFHLPGSTLLMLVCALGGHTPVMCAYNDAVKQGYRFFSYGDAMLIL
ncbi:MAG: tRNA preQ1(34) S-adenosylmethionine ribosyltransferase-isomerase QueA [Candidatus Cloacimonetes bacterium]|nr:tRNA preQ1(34) S-adenosylmethionine ribosyltransferase-isomerase QueA [Candidatus Cloacimonadota bacterium]